MRSLAARRSVAFVAALVLGSGLTTVACSDSDEDDGTDISQEVEDGAEDAKDEVEDGAEDAKDSVHPNP